jgi:dihydroflavonol-4-reductase
MVTVVTGANGHVGACLVRELLARGVAVRGVIRDDGPPALDGLDVELVRGDVREPDTLRAAFADAEVVYHCAALISIVGPMNGLVHETNVVGAANAARAALHAGVRRFVHFCSVHAFEQEPLHVPLDETRARVRSTVAPAYDLSKAEGEAAVRAAIDDGLDAVILHPSGIIGPHDYRPSRMGTVLLDLFHRRLPSLVQGGFDWVDVRDVASTAIAAAERGRTGQSYLVTGHWVSIPDIAAIAQECTGVPAPRLTSPMWLARVGAPFMERWAKLTRREPLYTAESLLALRANRVYVRDKAGTELGHAPRPTRESIRDAYAWFAEHGRIPRRVLDRLHSSRGAGNSARLGGPLGSDV